MWKLKCSRFDALLVSRWRYSSDPKHGPQRRQASPPCKREPLPNWVSRDHSFFAEWYIWLPQREDRVQLWVGIKVFKRNSVCCILGVCPCVFPVRVFVARWLGRYRSSEEIVCQRQHFTCTGLMAVSAASWFIKQKRSLWRAVIISVCFYLVLLGNACSISGICCYVVCLGEGRWHSFKSWCPIIREGGSYSHWKKIHLCLSTCVCVSVCVCVHKRPCSVLPLLGVLVEDLLIFCENSFI